MLQAIVKEMGGGKIKSGFEKQDVAEKSMKRK